ncbi:MAG TPA: transglycosylase SLT domain-containing protein [Pseudolysinimonas sp.]|nr:transglycosylase SLT domain-containing protein [Pseudolysinimonas sp.]
MQRRGVITALVAGLLGLAVLAGVVVLVLAPRLTAVQDAAAPAPRWAPPPASPPVAAATPGVGIATRVDPAWAASMAAATGIPERAVLAYAGAALDKAAAMPACRLSWTTLAAIGEVESSNGQHGGSSIGADGTVTPPIFGVALNGDGVSLIPDSDGGAIDGDATSDRAVGPMQLIPQTWRNWHTDGNGDGVENPQNIDDAVMATTNYLCRASTALDTEKGWRAAIGAYNSTDVYLRQVARAAVAYNADAAKAGSR